MGGHERAAGGAVRGTHATLFEDVQLTFLSIDRLSDGQSCENETGGAVASVTARSPYTGVNGSQPPATTGSLTRTGLSQTRGGCGRNGPRQRPPVRGSWAETLRRGLRQAHGPTGAALSQI